MVPACTPTPVADEPSASFNKAERELENFHRHPIRRGVRTLMEASEPSALDPETPGPQPENTNKGLQRFRI